MPPKIPAIVPQRLRGAAAGLKLVDREELTDAFEHARLLAKRRLETADSRNAINRTV